MKKDYVKPEMYCKKEPEGAIPAVALALGLVAASAAAVSASAVAAGTALAKKKGRNFIEGWARLPNLDAVKAYS
ncbi:MAG: hypothetical protein Ta2F_08870 [Termitinemataceae bacterium]|nr:MAG: hypothetical protein Ta2F_08870 [Termitinemataceae bacterium]